jgi:hypothetical protein
MQIPAGYDARADGPTDQQPFGYSIQPKESGPTALSGAAMNNEHGCAVLALILGLSSVPATLGGADRPSEMKALSLCELVANWKEYNRQTVRVRALFRTGPEEDWLEDPACGDAATWVDFRKDLKGPYKKLDRIISMDKRTWVVFEGVFHGPELFEKNEIDPRLPSKIREWLEKSHRRYGHLNAFDSMIDVTRVVEASQVAAGVAQ